MFTGLSAFSQSKIHLSLDEKLSKEIVRKKNLSIRDSTKAELYLKDLEFKAHSKGYLLFNIDSIERDDNNWRVFTFEGPKYGEMQLSVDSEALQFLKKNAGISEKLIRNVSLKPAEIARIQNTLLKAYVNNGYPFASVELKVDSLNTINLEADVLIEKGPIYRINKVIIRGDSLLSPRLVRNLIGIDKDELYSERKIRNIDKNLSQLSYLSPIKATEILFTPEGADLYIYQKRVPISSVNGIVGFQPNSTTEKVDITGEVNLRLINALNRGERIQLQWQSVAAQTQNLKSNFAYPYLFNSKFGVEGNLDLYKRDSTFLEINFKGAVNYFLSNSTYISAFYQGYSSNPLAGADNTAQFVSIGRSKVNLYGLGFHASKLDYLPNPRKGYRISFENGIGNRISRSADTLTAVKSLSYRGNIAIEVFIPLYRKHVLRLASQNEFVGSESGLFENEIVRFGGQLEQRGFNEDELYASTRSTQTIEYRFLLDRNAFLFAFFDQSWYENNASEYRNDTPYGFGAGISFSTGLGIFSLSYALGKQLDNPIRLADGKIHFGYVAYF